MNKRIVIFQRFVGTNPWPVLAFLLLLISTSVWAQPQNSNEKLLTCDDAVARQDMIVSVALAELKANSYLIVIVRPGAHEKSKKLESERLFNVQQYFRLRGRRIDSDKVIIATGLRTEGLGRLDFYLHGQLTDSLPYPRNGFLCHACCGPDTDFYPDKSRTKQKMKVEARKLGQRTEISPTPRITTTATGDV